MTPSTSAATSFLASTTLSSPTPSSTRSNNAAARCTLAASTIDAGTAPSPGSVPVYLPLENTAAHAASP
eukprot:723295-Pleurochrysis_carterae.AAC.1